MFVRTYVRMCILEINASKRNEVQSLIPFHAFVLHSFCVYALLTVVLHCV